MRQRNPWNISTSGFAPWVSLTRTIVLLKIWRVSQFPTTKKKRSCRRCGRYLLGSKTHPHTLKSRPSYQTSQAKEPGAAEKHGGWSCAFRKDAFPQCTSIRFESWSLLNMMLSYILHHCWYRITITYYQIALSFFLNNIVDTNSSWSHIQQH